MLQLPPRTGHPLSSCWAVAPGRPLLDQLAQESHLALARRHGKVGKLGGNKVEVKSACPPELAGLLDGSRVAGKAPGLLGSRAQVSRPCGGQPAVELIEWASRADRGEHRGEATPRRLGVVDNVRRDDAEVPAHGEGGKGVVARRVERVIVVEQLDDDALGTEPLDEPVELPRRRDRTGFHKRGRHGSLAAARQDEEVASRELGQPVDVVARAVLLATSEIALADGAGETGIALRVAGEDDQVGPGRVRGPGTRRRRDDRGADQAWAATGKGELSTEDRGHSRFLCCLGKAHHAVEPVVIGQCQSPKLEPDGFRDKFLGIRGTVEKTEI